jgi:hypothetical protein
VSELTITPSRESASTVALPSAPKALPSNSNKIISGLGFTKYAFGKACDPLMGFAGIRIINDKVSIASAFLVPKFRAP